MTTVETVRGPVESSELGVTLTHEHIFTKNPEIEQNYPHPEWDEEQCVQRAGDGLNSLYEKGIRTVVDLTVPGLGRYIPRIQRVAEAVKVNIVVATGFYTFKDLPTFFKTHSPGGMVDVADPLVDFFITDITEGIADTGVKAGMIKVATDEFGITPDVERVLDAAAKAHLETGVTISTHTHADHFSGRDQQKFFQSRGVSLEHVLIGHCGDSTDLTYLRELMDNGATLGMDRFGMEQVLPDEPRADTVAKLCELGYADRLTLSHDAGFYSINTPPSWRAEKAPNWHHANLPDRILPMLRERGVTEAQIEQMMVTNAARVLLGRRS